MTVEANHIQADCRLFLQVSCKDLRSDDAVESVFPDLNAAIEEIEKSLDVDDIYYFLIGIKVEGASFDGDDFDEFAERNSFAGVDAHNPWAEFSPAFWHRACATPALRTQVRNWLARIEKTLALVASRPRATESLWENDDTLFGEPLLAYLALQDIEFVPYYTRMLPLWDMQHAVWVDGDILEIVKKHGIRPETEELLARYREQDGSPDGEAFALELLHAER